MNDLLDIAAKLRDLGAYGVFAAYLYAQWRRWIVPGWTLDEAEARMALIAHDRDYWREIAMRGLTAQEKVIGT